MLADITFMIIPTYVLPHLFIIYINMYDCFLYMLYYFYAMQEAAAHEREEGLASPREDGSHAGRV